MTLKRPVTEQQLARARAEAADSWSVGDKYLYRLCRDYPSHTDERAVIGKIWLIGRAYAAAIERTAKRHANATLDQLYGRMARALRKSRLDSRLESLPSGGPKSAADLRLALETHEYLLDALKPMLRRVPRSFASKYLHFHVPLWFYIYDSVASGNLHRVVGRVQIPDSLRSVGDPTYRWFVAGSWVFRQQVDSGPPLTPRELDRLLYTMAP